MRASARFSRAVCAARPSWPRAVTGDEFQLRVGGLDQHQDAREALRQGVVDLAGQALPFGHDARLPADLRQLRPGRLELRDQAGTLDALGDDPADVAAEARW